MGFAVKVQACEAETSVMLHLFSDKVRQGKIIDYSIPSDKFAAFIKDDSEFPYDEYPGLMGYPSFATANKGQKLVRQIQEIALNMVSAI